MKKLIAMMTAAVITWLVATMVYLVITLPLEWREWTVFVNAANKCMAAAFGHGIYAFAIFILGLFLSFRKLGVRLAVSAVTVGLCVFVFGVTGGDNAIDWLRAFAHWVTAASMPFIFYAVYTRRLPEQAPR